jgi:hypothetical protein
MTQPSGNPEGFARTSRPADVAVRAVLRLHRPELDGEEYAYAADTVAVCQLDDAYWPCATVQAIHDAGVTVPGWEDQ